MICEGMAAAKGFVNSFALLVRNGEISRLISLKFDILIEAPFRGSRKGRSTVVWNFIPLAALTKDVGSGNSRPTLRFVGAGGHGISPTSGMASIWGDGRSVSETAKSEKFLCEQCRLGVYSSPDGVSGGGNFPLSPQISLALVQFSPMWE